MTTADIDPNAGTSGERLTNHIFDLSIKPSHGCGSSGQAICVPLDVDKESQWPPSSLFDAIYASTIIHQFGVNPKDIFKKWEYGQTDNQHRDDQDDDDYEKEQAERRRCYDGQWQGYHGRWDGSLDSFDVLAALPFIAMPVEKVRDYMEGCRNMAAARDHEALEVKVNSWRDGVPSET